MSKVFTIRVGDRSPYFAYKFGVSLEDVTAVLFSARDAETDAVFIDRQPAQIADGTYRIDGVMTNLSPADGVVFYPWSAVDTATARKGCLGLFRLVRAGGIEETWPSEGYERFVIGESF